MKLATPWLWLCAVGCAASAQPTEVPLGSSPSSPAATSGTARSKAPTVAHRLPDSDWQSFASQRFGFRLVLPDRGRWTEVTDARWLALVHPPSKSTLRLRSWRAPQRVTKEECRQQVYLWKSELRPASDPVVEGALRAPAGFDVGVRVDLFTEAAQGRRAVALAFGAAVRRCYAAYFETSLDTVTEAELGARLRLVTEGVFDRVEIMGVESLAEPEPASPSTF